MAKRSVKKGARKPKKKTAKPVKKVAKKGKKKPTKKKALKAPSKSSKKTRKKMAKKKVAKKTKKKVAKVKKTVAKAKKTSTKKKVVKRAPKRVVSKAKKVTKKVAKSHTKNNNKKRKSEKIAALLLAEREKILSELTHLEEMSLDKSQKEASGDLSGYSIHLADVASDNEEIEKVLRLRSILEEKIKWIDVALLKVKNGDFGICEECGEFIGIERLRVKPEAKYCIKCRAKLEAVGQY